MEIPATAARMALELARAAGFALDELCAGLAFNARSIGRRRRIEWDDYCVLVERIEAAAGGPKQWQDLLAASYHSAMPREIQAVFGAFISPKLLYRFITKVVDPQVFPTAAHGYAETRGGAIRISVRL